MGSQHTDKLVKSFISGSSDPLNPVFDKFADLQDPTYLSFKVDFFPDFGYSFPDDAYSSGGLFRPSSQSSFTDYSFYDSAADYLRRIGAPTRQFHLEAFIDLLYRLQNDAPWYFQSITGMSDLYTIDPANNYRGADKVLTFECLESIDIRLTRLADLYRNVAFDMQNMREVLPINLRTFNMNIHVLEFRKFNTTFGLIADALDASRATKGANRQQDILDANRRNVFNQDNNRLFTGTLDNLNSLGAGINNSLGGLFNGGNNRDDPNRDLTSAFEAISIQTFVLKDCEFDFYSEAPGYLETMSVKDTPEATYKFKVKVGKINKTSRYSFDKYVVAEYTKHSTVDRTIHSSNLQRSLPIQSDPYFEELDPKTSGFFHMAEIDNMRDLRESIFPSDRTTIDAYNAAAKDSDSLRKKPLERLLGGLLRNGTTIVNKELNIFAGEKTGGFLGTAPMGNVYEKPSFLKRAGQLLNDFLTPGNQKPQ